MSKTKLELTWIGKDQRPKLEPRILLEDPSKSYHADHKVSDNDLFDNKLIFGDNLLALKALEQDYAGKVKCVYIDPPFNTGEAFEYYDDGLEHSIWLNMMYDRIRSISKLLSEDGTLFVHIDDNELAYITVMLDEVFGRSNRAYISTFKQSSVSGPKSINPGLVSTTSFVLIYCKDKNSWRPNKLYSKTDRDSRYSKYVDNRNEDPSKWVLVPLMDAFSRYKGIEKNALKSKLGMNFEAEIEKFVLSAPECVVRTARVADKDVAEIARNALAMSRDNKNKIYKADRGASGEIYFLNGEQLIFYSSKTKSIDGEVVTAQALSTLWDDLLSNNLHKEGGVRFPKGKKPEGLIKRVIEMSTNEGDLVLDSFAGSGTTAAVAHKMKRKWITIELGEHCDSHILPRLKGVIDGSDQDGISKAVNWQGGGGFRYYKLAPSLLKKDQWDNWIINKEYNPEMLAEAVCKLENFTYAPSDACWWQHGHSTESDFIYATTQRLSRDKLRLLSEEVGENTLLVMCGAFEGKDGDFPNLTLKKLPKVILNKCEWDHDDYSLNVANLPSAISSDTVLDSEPNADQSATNQQAKSQSKNQPEKAQPEQDDLF
ncbi:site-specific DNA-methyltransferase [Oceanobacter mangrovi]|uniref:site-specific DNA-methyltransferase n=1 Tax=Oceanobacter mangrovi TaxID=2862510 RepID=UPI001C8DC25F|nr:site-specific DNA-methyltransferase [Oceanobacter mangrovi]